MRHRAVGWLTEPTATLAIGVSRSIMIGMAWTADDIPDQSGRTAVITGANTGLGLATAEELAAKGARVVLAVRDTGKGDAAAGQIRRRAPNADVTVQSLDLASLASIRDAAASLREAHASIDLLINNAGVMYTEKATTDDGFDLQFGVNHLGHFALTGLLIDRLLEVAGSRVVTVSSVGHRILSTIDFDDLNYEHNYNRVKAYGRSKLANLMFTYALQRRLDAAGAKTEALAAHPGGAATELARNSPLVIRLGEKLISPLLNSAHKGALATLRAATDPAARGGEYYGPDGPGEAIGHPKRVKSNKASRDTSQQDRLWAASEEMTGVEFPI